MKLEELNQILQKEVIVKMSKEKKLDLIRKIKYQLSYLKDNKVVEVSDLDYVTALNLKSQFREDYHVIGPATDEDNSKRFKPRYRLSFMLYQIGVQNA